jgi:hypothetical protein
VVRATCADVRIARGFARGHAVMDAFAMALRLMRLSDGHWVWSLPMPPIYRDAFTRGLNCGEGAAAQLARFGGAERATRALCIAALHMVNSVEVFVDAGGESISVELEDARAATAGGDSTAAGAMARRLMRLPAEHPAWASEPRSIELAMRISDRAACGFAIDRQIATLLHNTGSAQKANCVIYGSGVLTIRALGESDRLCVYAPRVPIENAGAVGGGGGERR